VEGAWPWQQALHADCNDLGQAICLLDHVRRTQCNIGLRTKLPKLKEQLKKVTSIERWKLRFQG
jgi:hypothetical protein